MDSKKMLIDLVNHVVKSTQHIVMLDSESLEPCGAGSGCLIVYKERVFFISVQHVTDKRGQQAVIDRGSGTEKGTNVFSIPELNYLSTFEIIQNEGEMDLNELEPLDICYAEIKGDIDILQKEIWFNDICVTADNKRILFTDLEYEPTTEEKYCFCGRIRAATYQNELIQTDKLVLGIEYDKKIGPFERFTLQNEITDHDDYIGTSGAPIISETGEPVAFIAHGYEGQKYVYGFSSRELKKYLDIYIDLNPV
jgi:hypothetical protein